MYACIYSWAYKSTHKKLERRKRMENKNIGKCKKSRRKRCKLKQGIWYKVKKKRDIKEKNEKEKNR